MSVDQGPTTVGSIVGKLRMDRAQWVADVAATKAEVREIEGLDPDIRIDDNAGAVITRLQAVKAATDAVDASSDRLGTTTRRTTDETVKANEANRTSVTRIGAIVTAVALLVPLLTPVAAGAIGIAGAFLGMGAAGVFALLGIHKEMEEGTSLGNSYRAGLGSLKESMDTLSRTSAVAMLSSFQRVVRETRAALPDLNTQVGQFSTILGRSGASLFSGAINSLRILNPLFLTAGLYLQSLAEGFERWSSSGGIDEFGTYALAVLPQVTDVLGKLASMVMHILQALAPLGTIGLAVLSGIAGAINAIPVDVLSQLIVTITWGAVAFKAWGFIAPMLATIATSMGAVGAATTIATGPIGWVVAGLSALAGVLAVIIARNQSATSATMAYTAAIEADTGAIAENTRVKAAQALVDNGALDAAKKLGVSVKTVTDATLGHRDAIKDLSLYTRAADNDQDALNQVMKESGLSYMETVGLLNTLVLGYRKERDAISDSATGLRMRNEALEESTAAVAAQQQADESAASALGISANALRDARTAQEGVESATAKATAEMYLQGDAAGLLKQQLDLLNGKALSAAEAQNQFEAQLVRLPDYIDEATGKFDSAGASLDGMSESAVTNRGALLDLIQSAQNSAQAYRNQGASSDEARQKLIDSKKAIEDQAVANGMNRDAVRRYLDELFKIPAKIPATKVEVDTSAAEAALAALTRSRTVTVNASLNAIKAGKELGWGYAGGGTIPGLAGGGGGGTVLGRGTAGDDNAGVFRLAQGEEVVSNMFGQASRNRALLKAINAGYTPAQSTAGTVRATPSTITAAPAAQAPVVQVDVHVTVLKNEDPAVVGHQVGSGVKQALAGVKL